MCCCILTECEQRDRFNSFHYLYSLFTNKVFFVLKKHEITFIFLAIMLSMALLLALEIVMKEFFKVGYLNMIDCAGLVYQSPFAVLNSI